MRTLVGVVSLCKCLADDNERTAQANGSFRCTADCSGSFAGRRERPLTSTADIGHRGAIDNNGSNCDSHYRPKAAVDVTKKKIPCTKGKLQRSLRRRGEQQHCAASAAVYFQSGQVGKRSEIKSISIFNAKNRRTYLPALYAPEIRDITWSKLKEGSKLGSKEPCFPSKK